MAAGLTATQVRAAIDGEPPRDRGLTGGLIALATTAVLLMVLIGEVIPPVVAFVVAFIGLAIGIIRSDARWLRWAAATVRQNVKRALSRKLVASDDQRWRLVQMFTGILMATFAVAPLFFKKIGSKLDVSDISLGTWLLQLLVVSDMDRHRASAFLA